MIAKGFKSTLETLKKLLFFPKNAFFMYILMIYNSIIRSIHPKQEATPRFSAQFFVH
jgi:hypothetical protein